MIVIMIMLQLLGMVDLGAHAAVDSASVKHIHIDEVGLGRANIIEDVVINEHQDVRRKLEGAEGAEAGADDEVDGEVSEASSENGTQEEGESTPGSDGAAEDDGEIEEDAPAESTAEEQEDDTLEDASEDGADGADQEDAQGSDSATSESGSDPSTVRRV